MIKNALLLTLLVLGMNPLARAAEVNCASDEIKVSLRFEIQSGWFSFEELTAAPVVVCTKPYESNRVKLIMGTGQKMHYSRIAFTVHPVQTPHQYFIFAAREQSLDDQTFEPSDSSYGTSHESQPLSIELNGWYHFQTQNMRVTFSI